MKKLVAIGPVLVAFVCGVAYPALAQVPQLIHYQGRLLSGTNLVNGSVGLSLRLFNLPGGGTSLYEDSNSVTVVDGLYSTFIGDTTNSGSLALALTNAQLWVEVAVNGSTLTPRERVASVAYALVADGVRAGGVTAAMLAPGAASSNLQAGGQSAVPGGGIVLSLGSNDTNLIANGYTKMGTTVASEDEWLQGSTSNAPTVRLGASVAWTGTELLLWGGVDGTNPTNTGGRYNPQTQTWTAMSTNGAPSARLQAGAVWSGSELIIWGGFDASLTTYFRSGARYNPTNDTWTAMNTNGAPSGRAHFTAVWSGSEMLVWGGDSNNVNVNTGARYNPTNDAWTPMTVAGAPTARNSHSAVWAGTQMIVWGGITNPGATANTGARYTPSPESWAPMTTANAPTGRFGHAALWTGGSMLVWAGNRQNATLNSGGIYNPSPESWTTMATINAPAPRMYPLAVWSGTEMHAWGGFNGSNLVAGGGTWADNSWRPITTVGEPSPRYSHSGVWTGGEMLFFGGVTNITTGEAGADTWSYVPRRILHLYQR